MQKLILILLMILAVTTMMTGIGLNYPLTLHYYTTDLGYDHDFTNRMRKQFPLGSNALKAVAELETIGMQCGPWAHTCTADYLSDEYIKLKEVEVEKDKWPISTLSENDKVIYCDYKANIIFLRDADYRVIIFANDKLDIVHINSESLYLPRDKDQFPLLRYIRLIIMQPVVELVLKVTGVNE